MSDSDLIQRLEAAEAGSRELDVEVFKAIGAPVPFQFMNKLLALEFNDIEQAYFARVSDDMQVRYSPPAYTTSLDAAMTLIPEGWRIAGLSEDGDGSWYVAIAAREARFGAGAVRSRAVSGPIGICIAALRARGTS